MNFFCYNYLSQILLSEQDGESFHRFYKDRNNNYRKGLSRALPLAFQNGLNMESATSRTESFIMSILPKKKEPVIDLSW